MSLPSIRQQSDDPVTAFLDEHVIADPAGELYLQFTMRQFNKCHSGSHIDRHGFNQLFHRYMLQKGAELVKKKSSKTINGTRFTFASFYKGWRLDNPRFHHVLLPSVSPTVNCTIPPMISASPSPTIPLSEQGRQLQLVLKTLTNDNLIEMHTLIATEFVQRNIFL